MLSPNIDALRCCYTVDEKRKETRWKGELIFESRLSTEKCLLKLHLVHCRRPRFSKGALFARPSAPPIPHNPPSRMTWRSLDGHPHPLGEKPGLLQAATRNAFVVTGLDRSVATRAPYTCVSARTRRYAVTPRLKSISDLTIRDKASLRRY